MFSIGIDTGTTSWPSKHVVQTKISLLLLSQYGQGKTPSKKQEQFQRAREATKFVVKPQQSLATKVVSLDLGFKKTQDHWYLNELQTVLAEADAGLNCRPAPTNEGSRRFTESDGFSMDDAAQVVQELQRQWSEIQDAAVDNIIRLENALMHAGIVVEVSHSARAPHARAIQCGKSEHKHYR